MPDTKRSAPAPYYQVVDRLAREVIAPRAAAVDADAEFPQDAIDALGREGFLGLISAVEVGGMGHGLRAAVEVIERIGRDCPTTAMVLSMHYAGAAVLERYGSDEVRRDVAAGRHLSTLAFSESGSRSHFWAPVSQATRVGEAPTPSAARAHGAAPIELNARKSWVTSARKATAYIWSSRPVEADGASTIWLVPSDAPGLRAEGRYDGLGLRGNDSTPVIAEKVRVDESMRLGEDGAGFAVMMETVLPIFNLLNATCSVGIMEGVTARTVAHASGMRYTHIDSSLADLPTIRAYIARMRIRTDMSRTLLADAVSAIESGRDDAMLRVLEAKAGAAEASLEVTSTGMRVCGGSAYRKDVGVERLFRDAQAAGIMAPTTDALYDFIGKAICGLPLF